MPNLRWPGGCFAVAPQSFDALRLTGTTLELDLSPASFVTVDLTLG